MDGHRPTFSALRWLLFRGKWDWNWIVIQVLVTKSSCWQSQSITLDWSSSTLSFTSTRAFFAESMSTLPKPQLTDEQIQKLKAKFTQFRILVIGRANAGKTTILRRLCNTTGDPMIFGPNGEKVMYMVKFHAWCWHPCPWSQIESSALDPTMGVSGLCTSIVICSINIPAAWRA